MTRYGAPRAAHAYARVMSHQSSLRNARLLVAGCTALPAASVQAAASTGVQGGGTALLLIGFAACLVLALLVHRRLQGFLHGARRRLGQRELRQAIRCAKFQYLEKFILPGLTDGLSRIDYAVLTSAGIVCIRALHGNGMVFGADSDAQWTQVCGVERRSLLNPLIQNAGRARSVQSVVGDMPVCNLVVFSGNVEFAVKPPDNVIPLQQLASWLRHYADTQACARDPEAAWLSLRAAALTDPASQKDFDAQLSFG